MQYTNDYRIRRLTPIECCRLQTVPDDYFFDENGKQLVSDTQIYRMLGNGWCVDVIVHILSYFAPCNGDT
jgi:DNA (cytosine-5)-methyltransferase 3A